MKVLMLYFNKLIAPILFLLMGIALIVGTYNPQEPQSTLFVMAGVLLIIFSLFWVIIVLNVINAKFAIVIALLTLPVIGWLGYKNFTSIEHEIIYRDKTEERMNAIKGRLLDLKDAQLLYNKRYGRYQENLDSLLHFLKADSTFEIKAIGDINDSTAVAKGEVTRDTSWMPILGNAFITKYPIDSIILIPFGKDNDKFKMDAGGLWSEGRETPVFEVKAYYKQFLQDLWDEYSRVPEDTFLRVGSMTEATINGSWN